MPPLIFEPFAVLQHFVLIGAVEEALEDMEVVKAANF